MHDISSVQGYETFTKIESISKGWSGDKKYAIETAAGQRLLLRIADASQSERKKSEFEMMKRVFALGVPMSEPIEFGWCDGGKSVYTLLRWCDGEDAEAALPLLTETEQYVLGLQSGRILKKIHAILAPQAQEDWAVRFARKTNTKIEKYRACGIAFAGDDAIIDYLQTNMPLLAQRPQCFQHGDYHVGNMVISSDGKLSVIDFNRFDFGDPWEELNRIVWSAAASPHFATGQLVGYFGGRPPMEFFCLLAFYISSNMLSSIYWAIPFGVSEVETMLAQARQVLAWFDGMKNPVPSWYIEDFHVQWIDGIPCKLQRPFDLSFVARFGTVFKVFDDQDSGNLCFGVRQGDERYFVKFAGAPTARACCSPEEAVQNLKACLPAYRALAHDNLIRLIREEAVGGGYAAVFAWADAACMGRMYPASRKKFMSMTMETKLRVFEDILAFHAHVHDKGYVAIDFYDGSILYDFEQAKTLICDIDFYAKKPYVNRMGRLWGSSRYMSPEEFTLGAEIDEVTNVYAMGATAFALFSQYDRTLEHWPLGEKLYRVVQKAVSGERALRQQSIRQLIDEWRGAAECGV